VGPIETVFLVIWAIFGIVGLVRGMWRELGVTTMLLIALLILQLLAGPLGKYWNLALELFFPDPNAAKVANSLFAVVMILLIGYISYEGDTLTFPGKGSNWFFNLGTGLLNGYLFAGSLWHYLAKAGWPSGLIQPPFTGFYEIMIKLLPPAVLRWELLIGLVIVMMIMRVIK
jgi:hypothetical protein